MTRMPVLETERLVIRPFTLDDLDAIHRILDVELADADTGSGGALSREERGRWLAWTVLGRRGYAAEAAGALVRYALGEMHAARVVATTTRDNVASMAVMRRLGMTIEENPLPEPPWLQVVGVLAAPGASRPSAPAAQ